MTFANLIATGRDRLRYRLEIEGWPDEWVTDPSITHVSLKDGRNVYPGLKCTGLELGERIVMQEAEIEADGMTFRIVPTDSYERPLASFANYPEPVAQLELPMAYTITSLAGFLNGGASLRNNTSYYIGSETIKVTTFPTIQRARWGSFACNYNLDNGTDLRATYIYDRPLTMEGRRAYLYAYGSGDLVAGAGQVIWRGMVTGPPRLDPSDGLTWLIDCGPITDVLNQQIAGKISEAHITGIYHHCQCAFAFNLYAGTSLSEVGEIYRYSGIDDEDTLKTAVDTLLATALAALSVSEIDVIELEKGESGLWRIHVHTTALVDFAFVGGSPILGTTLSAKDGWNLVSGKEVPGFGAASSLFNDLRLQANKDYYCDLTADNPAFVTAKGLFSYDGPSVSPLGNAAVGVIKTEPVGLKPPYGGSRFYNDAAKDDFPAWRVHVDVDMSNIRAIHVSDTLKDDGFFTVIGTGTHTDGAGRIRNYVTLEASSGPGPKAGDTPEQYDKALAYKLGFGGYLTSTSTLNAVRDYIEEATRPGRSGSVADFVHSLKAHAINSNEGDTPQITDEDLSVWELSDSVFWPEQLERVYRFAKAKTLDEILKAEAKFVCHFMRLDSTGKIDLRPLPSFTDGTIPDAAHTLDSSGIIPPAGGGIFGQWPGWDPQRDGLITMVEIADRYQPATDDWADQPIPYADANAIATHKSRGKVLMSIKPFSHPKSPSRTFASGAGHLIANQYLSAFGYDYNVITLEVAWKHFSCLCGDVVRVTHRLIPDGVGGRGIDRVGVVLSKWWPLDPAVRASGRLSILIRSAITLGYAPEAMITSQSNVTGNTWNLTCSVANARNVEVSPLGDGQILQCFGDDAFIRIVQTNVASPVRRTGRIVGTPNGPLGTCQVLLDSSWTPGASTWKIATQPNADNAHATNYQNRTAVYVADRDKLLATGAFTRRFA